MRRAAVLIAALVAGALPAQAGGAAGDGCAGVPRSSGEGAQASAASSERCRDGAGPVAADGRDAFSHPVPGLSAAQLLDFELGRAMFEKLWVSAPASTRASDGLGPLYNARACSACHPNNGRGRPPAGPGETPLALTLHVAAPAAAPGPASTQPDPVYGQQIQTFATIGLPAEARVALRWEETAVSLGDGEAVVLRKPDVTLNALAYGALATGALLSPRLAPPLIGLGLLEAIPAASILARADPDDLDGDGVSGRANLVWSAQSGEPVLGRFGLKADSPTVAHQTARAFSHDIGISSALRPAPWGDCTAAQTVCRTAPHGDGDVRAWEIGAQAFALTRFYVASLAVPAHRDRDAPQVLRGEALFASVGCASCHTPSQMIPRPGRAAPDQQDVIWPYTDLLLHDMGPGLADGVVAGRATGREWRTPPLWGTGLTSAVSGETTFLHDGRARSLLEAILWHGGEARAARDAVAAMGPDDREALMRFLESL